MAVGAQRRQERKRSTRHKAGKDGQDACSWLAFCGAYPTKEKNTGLKSKHLRENMLRVPFLGKGSRPLVGSPKCRMSQLDRGVEWLWAFPFRFCRGPVWMDGVETAKQRKTITFTHQIRPQQTSNTFPLPFFWGELIEHR